MNTEKKPVNLESFINQVKNQLIVSCQALPDEPLFGADMMVRMAKAALQGGAKAIRANTPVDIKAIKQEIDLPLIGLYKERIEGYSVFITPTISHVLAIAEAGADIIAIDATARPRPAGDLSDFISEIHEKTGCLVMADISTLEEGVAAEKSGADMVSSTLSGYTPYSHQQKGPDLELVAQLSRNCSIPVIAEGRYHEPEQVKAALANGATSVVVGGAITRPKQITERFVKAINS